MYKLLVKKQLTECFMSYFWDSKKNKMRSKGTTIIFFVLFGLLMSVVICGMFASVALAIVKPMIDANADWLYFLLSGAIATLFGVFGSVFNTYNGLYLSKDNDLLLSMPIPVKTIVASRITLVYLMGLLYSASVSLPMAVVYLIFAKLTVLKVVGAVLSIFGISLLVASLSCLLGWIVAKLSTKLKHKGFAKALLLLVFFAIYYLVFFKGQDLLSAFAANAGKYAEAIKTYAYPLYLLGSAACESWLALLVVNITAVGIAVLVCGGIIRGFLKIATASSPEAKKKYKAEKRKAQSANAALLGKEFRRLLSSAGYMFNAGFGVLMAPVFGVALLIKGRDVLSVIITNMENGQEFCAVIGIFAVCLVTTMVDTAIPSVSMEGKSLWVVQSLPVSAWQVIRAKIGVQTLLCGASATVALVCTFIAFQCTLLQIISGVLCVAVFVLAFSLMCMALGIRTANLVWTNENVPVKQNFAVAVAPIVGIVYVGLFFLLYLFLGGILGIYAVLGMFFVVTAIAAILLYSWNRKHGCKIFQAL